MSQAYHSCAFFLFHPQLPHGLWISSVDPKGFRRELDDKAHTLKIRCCIEGTGSYLPSQVITNHDLSNVLDTSNEWIESRTGIQERHQAAKNEYTSDLSIQAGKQALIRAKMNAEDLDLILLATSTPDHTFPPTASLVQNALGASRAIALDMNVACSGFIFALAMADSYIQQSGKNHALVIGGETMTRLVDWTDRKTAVLFGDGAGAVILSAKPSHRGIVAYSLFSDGNHYHQLHVSGGPSRTQTTGTIVMNGREVFRHAVICLEQATRDLLQKTGLSIEDIDWMVPHQANKRILDALASKLQLPPSKMVYTGHHHANTSAASIPLALDHGLRSGMIQPGQLLLLQAFGAGFSWGVCLVRA